MDQKPLRYSPAQAAVVADRAPITIYRALESGVLHGAQQANRGRWSIRPECLEAWLDGEPCQHKQDAAKATKLARLRLA